MGKGLKDVKTPAKPSSLKGRRSGEASVSNKTIKAVKKRVRQAGVNRGGDKKVKSAEGKKKLTERTQKASSPSTEHKKKQDGSTDLGKSGSSEKAKTGKTNVGDTVRPQKEASRGKRKRQMGAFKPRKKAPRSTSKSRKGDRASRGVIYIAHLPQGFFEPQLKAFFSQFGEVCRVRLFRSRKTAHSKGYAYVEFALREVAQIAAETLDKYRMFGRTLVCRLTDKGQVKEHVFRNCHKRFRRINWQARAAALHNKPEGQRPSARGISAVEKRLRKKAKRLEDAGIDVELPTLQESGEKPGNLFQWVRHERQELKAKKAKRETKNQNPRLGGRKQLPGLTTTE